MEAWRYVHITVIMHYGHIQWSRVRTQLNRKANLFIELNHPHIHLSLFVFILLYRTYAVTNWISFPLYSIVTLLTAML